MFASVSFWRSASTLLLLIAVFSAATAQVFAPGTTVTDVSCPGGNDGVIVYNLQGNGPLNYIWNDADTGVTLGQCTFSVLLDNTGAAQTDFQIPVRLVLGANMNADFSDVVFLDSAGNALTFWLQQYPVADTATFWVRLPNIPSGNFGFFLNFCGTSTTSASDPWATFDFFDDFDDGDISDWTPGCERATSSGEFCTQTVSTQNFSPGYSMQLYESGSCFVSPYNGAASTMTRTVTLPNYDYVIDFEDSLTMELYGFCSGGTSGNNATRADGTGLGNGAGAGQSGSCGTAIRAWAYRTSNNFNVATGSAGITLLTSGGDCAITTGWFDNVRIRRWSANPINVTVDSSAFITKAGLTAGTYVVQVTDAQGNVTVDSLVVGEPPAIVFNAGSVSSSCGGANDGLAYVTPAGGTPGYTVNWSSGDVGDTARNLAPGNYTAVVTDGNGCVDSTVVSVTGGSGLTLSGTVTDPLCAGQNTGRAVVTVTGGTPTYMYSWTTGDMTDTVRNLGVGTYGVTVTDANGCADSTTLSITNPGATVSLSALTLDPLCLNGSNGTANVAPTGGTAPYTYNWSNGDTTTVLDSLSAGQYAVTVTDANGCVADTSLTVSNPTDYMTVSATATDVLCVGENTGTGTITATGGGLRFIYYWNTGSNSSREDTLAAGTYSVTVVDAYGCTDSVTFTIGAPDSLQLGAASIEPACTELNNGAVLPAVAGGSGNYTYQWSDSSTRSTLTNAAGGSYSLTVTDANGCTIEDSYTIPADSLTISLGAAPDTLLELGQLVTLTAAGNITAISWSPSGALDDSTQSIVVATPGAGRNVFTATATSASGCTATDSISILVENEVNVFIPNAFTPNGDGINDIFNLETSGVIELVRLRIFDRWGELIFRGEDGGPGWDGTHNGKEVPPGLYVYDISYKLTVVDDLGRAGPEQRRKQGSVLLLK